MAKIYLVVKDYLNDQQILHISTIISSNSGIENILEAQKIEKANLFKKFPNSKHNISEYVGGEFSANSPEGKYLADHKREITVDSLLEKSRK